MNISQLVGNLLPVILKYGPDFVKSIIDLIHQNPGLTHEQYVVMITEQLDKAQANLDAIT